MISSKLKQHFIKKKTGKLLADDTLRNREGINEKIISVGIITKEEFYVQHDLQLAVEKQLELRNPRIYSYRKFDKHQEQSFKHFSNKDFNWKGEIIEPSLQSFLDHPYDLLLCYYTKPNLFLEYTTLLSRATFKVGFAEVNLDLFDLEITTKSSELDDFFTETSKYLSILNKI